MGKSLIIIGSRPTGLYGYDTNKDGSIKEDVKSKNTELMRHITEYIEKNEITDVYSTLDLGSEIIGAKAALNANYENLKNGKPGVNLHAMVQYPDQESKWPKQQQEDFKKICQMSADVTQISDSFGKEANAKRREMLKNIVSTNQAEVLMVYDGHEGENAMYTLNALKSACDKACVDAPKYLNPKTLEVTERRPFPDRPRLVSQERIDEINKRNANKATAGRYTREERKYASDLWKAYLDKLVLRPEHELDLLNRGFTKEPIVEFGYKSLPQTKEESDRILSELVDEGWDLSKAPGYAIEEDGGAFSAQIMKDGYFCPARDTEEDILYGMQIRNCDKEEAEKYGKYTWFSAGKNAIGLSSSQPAAYYKGSMTANVDGKERPVILITEGVLKCNLAYLGMGRQIGIVGMAGVYGQKGLYVYDEKGEAETLPENEARHLFKDAIVVECFDADFVKNKNVRNASYRIRNQLVDNYGAYATCRMTWEDEGKGIDDYVVDCNRAGKDIHYNLSNVIMSDSPTEIVTNEFGKPETRHVEIQNIEDSPLKGFGIDIKMQDVYDAGYKIQPKIEVPKKESETDKSVKSAPVEEHVETEEEHRKRKYVEHLNEHTGRRDDVIRSVLNVAPATCDTKYANNSFKFVIEIPNGSTMDKDLKRRAEELAEYTDEVLGVEEPKNKSQRLFVSDSIPHGDRKAVVVMATGFNSEYFSGKNRDFKKHNTAVSAALKGSIQDIFYREQPAIGRSFAVSSDEYDKMVKLAGINKTTPNKIVVPNNGKTDVNVQPDERYAPRDNSYENEDSLSNNDTRGGLGS